MASSPLARRGLTANSCFLPPFSPQLMFHVIGGKDVVVWEEKPQKPETDLSEIMEALATTRSCCLLSEHYNLSRIGSSYLANQRRFITNNNNNNNRKLKKKKKNDWLLSSSKSLNSPNFTVQPLQLDELGKNRNLYHCSWVGRTLNLPVYFGDAVSREVLYKVGAERVCAAAITLDTPGSNYRTVWALNKTFSPYISYLEFEFKFMQVVPETLEPSLQLVAVVLAQAKLPTSEIAATIDEFRSRHLSELTELCEASGSCLGYGYSRLMSKPKSQPLDPLDENQVTEGTLAI